MNGSEDAAARKRRIQAERRRNRMMQKGEDRLGLITGDRRAPGLDIKEVEQPTEDDLKKLEKLARPIAGISGNTGDKNPIITAQNTRNTPARSNSTTGGIPNPVQQLPPQAKSVYSIPSSLIFLVVFGIVWISFILQYDPIKIVFALYLLLTTAQMMDHVILIPASSMLNMTASMLGPNIGRLVKTLYYLYRSFSIVWMTLFSVITIQTLYLLYNGVPLVLEENILKMDLSTKINQMKNTINSHNNDADDGFDPNF